MSPQDMQQNGFLAIFTSNLLSLIPGAENAWHCIVVSNAMLQMFGTEATELILGGKLILLVGVVT